MKTCSHCGTDLPDGARFCMQCGTPQEGTPGPTVQAQVTGSGAVAQGPGAVAAGERGIAVGILHGNIYAGPPPNTPVEALRIYRQVLAATVRDLPLRGVDLYASDPRSGQKPLNLAQVYIQLDTRSDIPNEMLEKVLQGESVDFSVYGIRERPGIVYLGPRADGQTAELVRPLPALIAAVLNRRLVLLGDPGSGKSTFLNHLALCLAMAALEPEGRWSEHLPGWPAGEMDAVPILLLLRDFARATASEIGRAEPHHLWDFICRRLKAQNLSFAVEPIQRTLEEGRAILLLDGLDEVPTPEQRAFVRDAVAAFANRYPDNRFIVTCRTLSYQDPAMQLAGFPPFELAPFDKEKIDNFIEAWYAELARLGTVRMEDAEGLARRLRDAVRRPDLWRLAPNPLLLTVMALVHTHKGRLPDARALLYEDTVDILLWRWEQIKAGVEDEAPPLRRLLLDAGRTDVDLKRTLWRLAFEAHQEGGATDEEALADIGELRLEKALAALHPQGSRDWAQQVIEAMRLRAGLLLERAPEVFTFPHRTFQEYLAGAHLSAQADFARQAARLVEQGPFWREVVLLAVGRLVYLSGDTDKPLALVGELCPEKGKDEDLAWRKAWLAGEVLVEAGPVRVEESGLGRDLVGRVRGRLADLLALGRLSAVERAAAGRALARLGDPRFRADAWFLPDEPLLGFVEIPAGPFTMGTRKEDIAALLKRLGGDREWYEREVPQHQVTLPGYYIARYPVTVAQWRAFVKDSGHKPEDPDSLRGVDNHPVVRVTWYEAIAYCRWLTEKLKVWEGTPEPLATLLRAGADGGPPWIITLPSEAQWEKAARGTDGRIYPWGDNPDPARANYANTGIGTTSAVGCFPGGAGPYGVEDLSGNVWEWTRSLWGRDWQKPKFVYPYDREDGRENLNAGDGVLRVLRGGAFGYGAWSVRCACRDGDFPDYRDRNVGFRLVASPVF